MARFLTQTPTVVLSPNNPGVIPVFPIACITVTSLECYIVQKHRKLTGLFNHLFRLTVQKRGKICIIFVCDGNHQWQVVSPQKASNVEKMSGDDVIMFPTYQITTMWPDRTRVYYALRVQSKFKLLHNVLRVRGKSMGQLRRSRCLLSEFPAWTGNHIHYKVWNEITYPFPNFNGTTVEVWE